MRGDDGQEEKEAAARSPERQPPRASRSRKKREGDKSLGGWALARLSLSQKGVGCGGLSQGGGQNENIVGLFIRGAALVVGAAAGRGRRGEKRERARATLRHWGCRARFWVRSFLGWRVNALVWWWHSGRERGRATSERAAGGEKRERRRTGRARRRRRPAHNLNHSQPRCLLSLSCRSRRRATSSGASLRSGSSTGTAVPPPPQLRQGLRPVPLHVRQPTSWSLQRTHAHSSLPVPPHAAQSRLPRRLGSCVGLAGLIGWWVFEGLGGLD